MFTARYLPSESESKRKSNPNLNPNPRKLGRPVKPLSRDKYGKLTPIEYLGNRVWECECECGWLIMVHRSHLESGITTSCGCGRLISQISKIPKGGKLPPKHAFFEIIGVSKNHYLCCCICESEFILKKEDLHDTLSCGCIAIGKRLPLHYFGESHVKDLDFYQIWKNIKTMSRIQGVSVDAKWKSNFIWFLAWAINQHKPEPGWIVKPYLHRKDCNLGYHPWNCEITYGRQNRGKKASKIRY